MVTDNETHVQSIDRKYDKVGDPPAASAMFDKCGAPGYAQYTSREDGLDRGYRIPPNGEPPIDGIGYAQESAVANGPAGYREPVARGRNDGTI